MAINKNVNIYGRENTNPAALTSAKSKAVKSYGIRFPFGLLEDGLFLKKSSDLELIKSNLRQLILTKKGERVMLPEFGTNIKEYLMEPLDPFTLNQIRLELLEAIYRYAPDVQVDKIQVFAGGESAKDSSNGLNINLFCSIKENVGLQFEVKVELS
jgi:phage baseplate assembly protein W